MYLGLDLGTSGLKAIIINDNKEIIFEHLVEYDCSFPKTGWSEQDPLLWKNAMFEIFKNIPQDKISKIKSISFSGQMHGSVFLDENDQVIRHALLWNDQRTEAEVNHLNKVFPKKDALQELGNIFLTGYTAPKVLWLKNHEAANFKKLRSVMLPKDYLAFILSAVKATDYSDASGTAYLNVKERKWSTKVIKELGIDISFLPKLFESNESIGNINKFFIDEFGFNTDVKIIIGGGDQAVGAVGVGATKEGIISCAFGTSGVILAPSKKLEIDSEGRMHSFASASGEYLMMGVSLSTGASVNWFMKNIARSNDFSEMMGETMDEREITDIIYTPYLNGERTPHFDSQIRSSILNLDISHDILDISKAVLEGIIFSIKDSLEILKDNHVDMSQIMIHGGITNNNYFNQMVANIFGMDIYKMENVNGPAFGAALIAMAGATGISMKEINNIEKSELIEIKYNNTISKRYEEKYALYKEAYSKTKK